MDIYSEMLSLPFPGKTDEQINYIADKIELPTLFKQLSLQIMLFDILLPGGIGTKLLRLIAGCGDDKSWIQPSDIRIIDQYYSSGDQALGTP